MYVRVKIYTCERRMCVCVCVCVYVRARMNNVLYGPSKETAACVLSQTSENHEEKSQLYRQLNGNILLQNETLTEFIFL